MGIRHCLDGKSAVMVGWMMCCSAQEGNTCDGSIRKAVSFKVGHNKFRVVLETICLAVVTPLLLAVNCQKCDHILSMNTVNLETNS